MASGYGDPVDDCAERLREGDRQWSRRYNLDKRALEDLVKAGDAREHALHSALNEAIRRLQRWCRDGGPIDFPITADLIGVLDDPARAPRPWEKP